MAAVRGALGHQRLAEGALSLFMERAAIGADSGDTLIGIRIKKSTLIKEKDLEYSAMDRGCEVKHLSDVFSNNRGCGSRPESAVCAHPGTSAPPSESKENPFDRPMKLAGLEWVVSG
jgi:hypothetical protein